METKDKGTDGSATTLSDGNMSTLHKYVLRKNRVTIKEELELSVVDYLVSKGVFTLAHSEDILAEKTRRDKAGRLLDLLERRGFTAFDALVDSLKKTQRHVAEMLEKWTVEAAKIDEKTMNKFIYDDEIMKDRAGLPLNIVTIHLEQRTGSSVQTVDLPLSLEYILGDETRYRLMCSRLQELGASIFSCHSGSISLLLSFEIQKDLSTFWLSYNDGSLQDKLASVFVSEELKQKYPESEFSLIMDIDIEQYINAVRELDANKPQPKAVAESPQPTSDSETGDPLKKYADLDIAVQLRYLHGEADRELVEAQRVLENRLFRDEESQCMEALSQFLESRGMLLTDHSKSGLNCLQAQTLNLSWLSQLDAEFSWSLDTTHFASLLLDKSVMEAAKGHPLNISCYLKSVRVGHITSEKQALWTRLKELEEQVALQSAREEHAEVQRYLAQLTTKPPTDLTSETSGFVDDFELESSAHDVKSTTGFPVTADVDKPVYTFEDPEKKGLLVIINNSVFHPKLGLGERRGSDIDVARLHTVFTDLGFRVQVMQNLRAAEMVKVLSTSAKKAGDSGFSCFVSAILTHGHEQGVFGTDAEIPTKDLIDSIASVEELAGKPKIIFIQAARGAQLDEGIPTEESEGGVKPRAADLLVCNSSAPGYFSWRNTTSGSWFVNAIEKVFSEYGETEDVLSLMTRVGHAVSKQQSFSPEATMTRKMQMPVFESSLTKTLYFTPPKSNKDLQ